MPIKLTDEQRIIMWFNILCAEKVLWIYEDKYSQSALSHEKLMMNSGLRFQLEEAKRHNRMYQGFRDYAGVFAAFAQDACQVFKQTKEDKAYDAYILCLDAAKVPDAIFNGWKWAESQNQNNLEDMYSDANDMFESSAGHAFYGAEHYAKLYNQSAPNIDIVSAEAIRRVR